MNGFIHIYTRGKEPKTDQIIIRFDKVNVESYDEKLRLIHVKHLEKNIYAKDSYGHTKRQGNIGVLCVLPAETPDTSLAEAYQARSTDFIGQFNGHLVEFTLSDNVKVVPTYGLHPAKRDSFTIVKFHQFDVARDCYHEVLLMTKEGALNFEVSHTNQAQRINIAEWNELLKKHQFSVDVEETYTDVDRELFLEDIFHNVTEEALVSTGIGRAFDPTFRVIPVSDEAAVVKKVKALPVPPPEPEPEKEIKVGMLMMLEESDEEDGEAPVSSDSSDDDVGQEYNLSTGGVRKYYEECQLDMSLAPPAYIESAKIGIITTPDLLKQVKPEPPIRMSDLFPNLDLTASPPLSKLE